MVIEPLVEPFEALIEVVESLVRLIEGLVNLDEPLIEDVESLVRLDEPLVSHPSRPLEATAEGAGLIPSLRALQPTWARPDSRLIEGDSRRVAAPGSLLMASSRLARLERGIPVLGLGAVLRQNPLTRPGKTKKSPAPRFHAATKAIRDGLREAYGLFLAAFRNAAELLKAGDRSARFPLGRSRLAGRS